MMGNAIRRSKRVAESKNTKAAIKLEPVYKKIKKEDSDESFQDVLKSVKSEKTNLQLPSENESEQNHQLNPIKKETITREPVSIKVEYEAAISLIPSKSDGFSSLQPANWEEIYEHVKVMRSKIVAPVDTMGCERLPERIAGKTTPKNFRFQLLISLMLSSQTKDEINYKAMLNLHNGLIEKGFPEGLTLNAILQIEEDQINTWIFSVGFHTRKASYIKKTAIILTEKFDSDVPKTIEEIMSLPGVGPKMGYLLLQRAWNINDGIGVDVHVFRLANMWSWVPKIAKPNPENTRMELQKWLPKEYWHDINPLLVGFGQTICLPRGRKCDICSLASLGLCKNVDRKLLLKVKREGPNSTSSRGDISGLVDIEDIISQ